MKPFLTLFPPEAILEHNFHRALFSLVHNMIINRD